MIGFILGLIVGVCAIPVALIIVAILEDPHPAATWEEDDSE